MGLEALVFGFDLRPGIRDVIDDPGEAAADSVGTDFYATEWSGGSVISLGGLPGSTSSTAWGINDAGQAVGESERFISAPESSTWAMMFLGFAGLGYAGYRRARESRAA